MEGGGLAPPPLLARQLPHPLVQIDADAGQAARNYAVDLFINADARSALEVMRSLCAEVAQLHPALTTLGVPVPAAMPGEIATLAALADAALQREQR